MNGKLKTIASWVPEGPCEMRNCPRPWRCQLATGQKICYTCASQVVTLHEANKRGRGKKPRH